MSNHENVIAALSGSVWLVTDDLGMQIGQIANSILDGSNRMAAEAYRASLKDSKSPRLVPPVGTSIEGLPRLRTRGITFENGVAVVPVMGTIMPRATFWSNMSGGVSAEDLRSDIIKLGKADNVHTIILRIDSNGGQAQGVMQVADAIRAVRENKRVWAIAEYNANSAAYWIGSAASKFFVTPDSITGSIGAIVVLEQYGDEDKKRFIVWRSVKGKATANAVETLTEDARKDVQRMVDTYHQLFVNAVSLNRNITMDKALLLADGTTEIGAAAVERGLADGVVASIDEVIARAGEDADMDARLTAVSTAYTELAATHADQTAQLVELKQEMANLKAEREQAASAAAETAARAAVMAAVNAEKIPAATADDRIADIINGRMSLAAFTAMMESVPAKAATGSEDIDVLHAEKADPLAPVTEEERRAFASDPEMARKYGLR